MTSLCFERDWLAFEHNRNCLQTLDDSVCGGGVREDHLAPHPGGSHVDADTRIGYDHAMDALEVDTITDQAAPRTSTSYAHDKAKIMARLRRMEGQVRGVQRMVEEDQYCLDVLTQLSAVIAAARQTGLLVLEDHIRACVLDTCPHDHVDREELLTELMGAMERFSRSVG